MDIYLDLSLILEVLITLGNIYFVYNLSKSSLKKRFIPLLIIFNSLSVYLYSFNIFFNIFLQIIFVIIFFVLANKKDAIINSILYLVSDVITKVLICYLLKDVRFYNSILVINKPYCAISYLMVLFLSLSIFLSTKFVDRVYRLSNYKTSCYIEYLGNKVFASAYFDTGNTLKYLDVPVIFTSISNFPFSIDKYEDIEVSGINGMMNYKAIPCLLSIEDKKESTFIYLALLEDKKLFHGCEVLLNMYLV